MNHDRLRRKIIETAADCFLKYGIKNTSMDFVSEVLHISKRTLYQFFPSKCDLLESSCDEGRQAEAYSNAILTYLAGICTDEGRKRLNNIIVESHYENERKNV